MAPRQRVIVVALVIVAIGLVAAVLFKTKAAARKPQVTLVAYYPFNPSHKPSVDMVTAMAQKYPGKVAAEAYDFTTPEGRDKWLNSGLSCAGVLINGTTEWNVLRDGKPEKVSFQKREGILWTEGDLDAVVKQLIEDPSKPAVVTGKAASGTAAEEAKPAAEKKPEAPASAKDLGSSGPSKPAASEAKPAPSKTK